MNATASNARASVGVPSPAPLDRHLITVASRPTLVFAEGCGSWLKDEQGKQYLDLV